MHLTFNKVEFQHLIMVYHYYIQKNLVEISKGIHPSDAPLNQKRSDMVNEDLVQLAKISFKKANRGSGTVKLHDFQAGNSGSVIFKEENGFKWVALPNGKVSPANQTPQIHAITAEWKWAREDKLWTTYNRFIKNRSLVFFLMQRWTKYRPKAKLYGWDFARITNNIETQLDDSFKIRVYLDKSLVLDKIQWQHFMMLYMSYNLSIYDELMIRTDSRGNPNQWTNEDDVWSNLMYLYRYKGVKKFFERFYVSLDPMVRSYALPVVKTITNFKEGDDIRTPIMISISK